MIRSKLIKKCYCIIYYSICFLLLSGCGNTITIPPNTARDSGVMSTEKSANENTSKQEITRLDFGDVFSNFHDWEGVNATEEVLLAMTNKEKQKLKTVGLRWKFTDKSMLAIQGLKNIEHLSLGNNWQMTEKGMLLIGTLPNLKGFVYIAPYDDSPRRTWEKPILTTQVFNNISHLKHFEGFSVFNSHLLTDDCFTHLHELPKLTTVVVDGDSPLTEKSLEHFTQIKNLQKLAFRIRKWNGKGLRLLQKNTKLIHLDLSDSALDDNGVKHLEGFQQLVFLELSDTKITDASMESIAKLKNLKSLYLNDTAITKKSLVQIKKLSHLEHLATSGTADDEVFKQYIKFRRVRRDAP